MASRRTLQGQAGFTLVELSVAAAILAVLLMVLTVTFINLVRMERSAVSLRETTQNGRYGLDDITAEARAASSFQTVTPNVSTGLGQLCLYQPSSMVQYFVDTPSGSSDRILYKANRPTTDSCTALTLPATTGATAVTSDALNVAAFQAWPPQAGVSVPLVTVRLSVTTVTDLTRLQGPSDPAPGNCRDGDTTYCSVSAIETSISLRGGTS